MIVLALKPMEFHWLKYSERHGYQVAVLDDLDACRRFPFTKAAESLPQNLSETPVEINEAWSGTLPGIRFALVMRSSFVLSLLLCSAGAILLQPGPDLN